MLTDILDVANGTTLERPLPPESAGHGFESHRNARAAISADQPLPAGDRRRACRCRWTPSTPTSATSTPSCGQLTARRPCGARELRLLGNDAAHW